MIVLCIDAGSSSCKFGVYRNEELEPVRVFAGQLPANDDADALIDLVVRRLSSDACGGFAAVAHRLVFGGHAYVDPLIANERVVRDLEALVPIEPLHLRAELDLVNAAARRFPELPQVLCFDTAFHRSLPAVAKRLPLPAGLDPMLQRYGFHGLSYEYIVSRLPVDAGRTVVAHLGSGASLCAIRGGKPVETTMGFSALGGLMMGTRPGDLDPGIVVRLLQTGYDLDSLVNLFYYRSGLTGVSNSSPDVRVLLERSTADAQAREAINLYVHILRKQLGAMIAALGGIDSLVFTGGVGEHEPAIRSDACEPFAYLNCFIDASANARNDSIISSGQSSVTVSVIPTEENLILAKHAFAQISVPAPQ